MSNISIRKGNISTYSICNDRKKNSMIVNIDIIFYFLYPLFYFILFYFILFYFILFYFIFFIVESSYLPVRHGAKLPYISSGKRRTVVKRSKKEKRIEAKRSEKEKERGEKRREGKRRESR